MRALWAGLPSVLIACALGGAAVWYIRTAAAYLHSVGLLH
jgi:hypothetical protein